MKKRREIIFTLLSLLIGVTLTLVLGEVVTRVISSKMLIYNIEMVKYAKTLKKPDPSGEVSHVHVPNRSAHLMGVDVALNSLGHRGRDLTPKQPGLKRMLVLGSSVTMGWGVPAEKVVTAVVEEKLNAAKPFGPEISFETANAGIGNYNTYFQYKLFQKQYSVVKPDIVVIQYFISDVEPRSMGRNSWLLKHSFLADYLFDRYSLLQFTLGSEKKDLFSYYADFYKDDNEAWKKTQQCLAEIRQVTRTDGVPFIIMLIPDIHDVSQNSPYRDLYTKMEAVFNKLEIPTINTFDAFQKEAGNDVSRLWIQSDDPHPNAKGHALMADALYGYLVEADPLKLKQRTVSPAP
jgi:lysophospholipase L1-like esterase